MIDILIPTLGRHKALAPLVANLINKRMIQIDHASHKVTVGSDAEAVSRTVKARELNWISIPELSAEMRVQVKIRHRHEPAWATLRPAGDDEVGVTFDEPVRAVTPGQAAVFYAADEVIGGGWII